jgi:pantetheine-phosphate adenylyltransferase
MKKACFPGSFDPFTKGHEDVVRRGLKLFDTVVIAVGHNSSKQSLFSLETRLAHIRSLFSDEPRVLIETFEGLTIDFCKQQNCTHLLRGLRDGKDFNYEQPIALMNRTMSDIETVFILPDPSLLAINSTIVREIYKNGGKIDAFVTNAAQLVN